MAGADGWSLRRSLGGCAGRCGAGRGGARGPSCRVRSPRDAQQQLSGAGQDQTRRETLLLCLQGARVRERGVRGILLIIKWKEIIAQNKILLQNCDAFSHVHVLFDMHIINFFRIYLLLEAYMALYRASINYRF